MTDNLGEQLSGDLARQIRQTLKRLRMHLHEAEVQAPAQIFQMIEELRSLVANDTQKARQNLHTALQRLGASEEEFLEWLELDVQLLERKLLKALALAADPSKVDLDAWRKADP